MHSSARKSLFQFTPNGTTEKISVTRGKMCFLREIPEFGSESDLFVNKINITVTAALKFYPKW